MTCKNFLLTGILLLFLGCTKSDGESSSGSGGCGTHSGHSLYKGPDGGCYYINDSGNKVYVDRSECHC